MTHYGTPGFTFRVCADAYPPSRGGGRPLWSVDDRGARASWVQDQLRYAVSDAPRDGAQGLSQIAQEAGWPNLSAGLSRYALRPKGFDAGALAFERAVR